MVGRFLLQTTLQFGLPLLALALYLLGAGAWLNRRFAHRLAARAAGQAPPRSSVDWLSRCYGGHLIVLILLAYALLLFSPVVILGFVYIALVITDGMTLPVMLLIAVPVVALVSLWGVLRGLFGRPKLEWSGEAIAPDAEPELWAISREVAAAVGTRPADRILLTPLTELGVYESGGLLQLLLGRTRRSLVLGGGSLVGLTVAEFRAVLAHEYAHFSNRDTAWSALTARAAAAVLGTVGVMRSASRLGSWFTWLTWINPACWLLVLYQLLFGYVTAGFTRLREVAADDMAISLGGATAFRAGLARVAANGRLFADTVARYRAAGEGEGNWFAGLYGTYERAVLGQLAPGAGTALLATASPDERPTPWDSHPPLATRLAGAGAAVAVDEPPSDAEDLLTSRFVDWTARAAALDAALERVVLRTK